MRRFLENSEKEQNLGTLQREEYRKAKLPADPLPEGRQGALWMERIPQESFWLKPKRWREGEADSGAAA